MIGFHNDDISFRLKDKLRLKRWIRSVIGGKKKTPGDIQFIFCSDARLLEVNKEYLDHDTFTDIITFDYSEGDAAIPVSGDIFISLERVKENAVKYGVTMEEELHRILIHGVLHLLGYKDKTKLAKAEMTKEEDRCLRMLARI